MLFADLDGFKAVNDTHGHGVGDAVLTVVARRLEAAIRPGDVIARVGGDEFAVLCVDLADHGDALAVADRLIEAVSRPIQVGGVVVEVGPVDRNRLPRPRRPARAGAGRRGRSGPVPGQGGGQGVLSGGRRGLSRSDPPTATTIALKNYREWSKRLL